MTLLLGSKWPVAEPWKGLHSTKLKQGGTVVTHLNDHSETIPCKLPSKQWNAGKADFPPHPHESCWKILALESVSKGSRLFFFLFLSILTVGIMCRQRVRGFPATWYCHLHFFFSPTSYQERQCPLWARPNQEESFSVCCNFMNLPPAGWTQKLCCFTTAVQQ